MALARNLAPKHGKIVDKIESEFVSPADFSPLK